MVEQASALYEQNNSEQMEEAIALLQTALTQYTQRQDIGGQAFVLTNLSLLYQKQGNWTAAQAHLDQSLKLLNQQPKSPDTLNLLAQTWSVQGQLSLNLGHFRPALKAWENSTQYYQQIRQPLRAIETQINQTLALQNLGLYREALNRILQLNPPLLQLPNSPLKATGIQQLAQIIRLLGDVPELTQYFSTEGDYLDHSERLLKQSLQILEETPSPALKPAILLELGNTLQAKYYQKKDLNSRLFYEKIDSRFIEESSNLLQILSQTIDTYQQVIESPLTPPLLNIQAQTNRLQMLLDFSQHTDEIAGNQDLIQKNLALLATELQNLEPLLFKIALLEQHNLSHQLLYAKLKLAHALTESQPKDFAQAAPQLLEQVIEQSTLINNHQTQSYAKGYLGTWYEKQHQWPLAQQLTQEALLLAQQMQSPELLYQWQWQLGRILAQRNQPKQAILAYQASLKSLDKVRLNLTALNNFDYPFLFRDDVEPVYRQFAQLLINQDDNPSLQQAAQIIEQLQVAELEDYLRCQLRNDQGVPLNDYIVQNNLNTAVISLIVLEDQVHGIVKFPKDEKFIHFARKADDIEAKVAEIRDHIKRKINSTVFSELYRLLIEPVEDNLQSNQISSLVFILDSELKNIPLNALYDGEQYLIEKYSLALNLGFNVLETSAIPLESKNIIAAGVSEENLGQIALPFVEKELSYIQSKFPQNTILKNQEFTPFSFKNALIQQSFNIVHLATHGMFKSDPNATYISAYKEKITLNQLSSILQTQGERTETPLDLLVLSACQTAIGDKRATLGLAGISIQSGARSTIASLFDINDAATAILISHFYDNLAEPEMTKGEALRQAQVQLLQNLDYRLPYFWSSYVLVGNWQ
ncbi:CHAT domain-containing protein [Spirulina subsalsa FACHB-351]|uniref:CHAT domain-containing protein n=1 Tax=Spirulina subsalsa FACHB-351 TaxID=234711 RepID=A0ABT3L2G2_9CYAN|nr:CHAT domain-containing protein [Spirulina subsalsa]MCW6035703.1 CHAT domain-containing protein [Spirulina subsalsa FACHB-351]